MTSNKADPSTPWNDAKTMDKLSQQQRAKEKSEQHEHSKEDKRKVAREEHTNGSTPSSKL